MDGASMTKLRFLGGKYGQSLTASLLGGKSKFGNDSNGADLFWFPTTGEKVDVEIKVSQSYGFKIDEIQLLRYERRQVCGACDHVLYMLVEYHPDPVILRELELTQQNVSAFLSQRVHTIYLLDLGAVLAMRALEGSKNGYHPEKRMVRTTATFLRSIFDYSSGFCQRGGLNRDEFVSHSLELGSPGLCGEKLPQLKSLRFFLPAAVSNEITTNTYHYLISE